MRTDGIRHGFGARESDFTAELVLRDGKTAFLVSEHGEEVIREKMRLPSGESMLPYASSNNLLTHGVVLVPGGTEEYGTELDLYASVRAFIHRYVDVSSEFEAITSLYVLFSWRYDDFSELPYLRVRGDYGSGKSRFLQVVGSLCYRPIFASGASTVSPLFRILDAVQGTLVIDEGDFRVSDEKAEVVKILNNGNAKGFPLLRSVITREKEFNPQAFSVYGPKIIATRRDFHDEALESRCLTEDMGRRNLRPGIPLSLPESFREEACSLRNCLLRYRFTMLGKVDRKEMVFPGEPRTRQVLVPLLQVAVSEEARDVLYQYAERLSGNLLKRRATSLEADVLQVLFDLKRKGERLSVKEVAQELSFRLEETITPRRVGFVLRHRLLLQPVKRRGVFVIPEEDHEVLLHLFRRHGIEAEKEDRGDVVDMGDVAEDVTREVERR